MKISQAFVFVSIVCLLLSDGSKIDGLKINRSNNRRYKLLQQSSKDSSNNSNGQVVVDLGENNNNQESLSTASVVSDENNQTTSISAGELQIGGTFSRRSSSAQLRISSTGRQQTNTQSVSSTTFQQTTTGQVPQQGIGSLSSSSTTQEDMMSSSGANGQAPTSSNNNQVPSISVIPVVVPVISSPVGTQPRHGQNNNGTNTRNPWLWNVHNNNSNLNITTDTLIVSFAEFQREVAQEVYALRNQIAVQGRLIQSLIGTYNPIYDTVVQNTGNVVNQTRSTVNSALNDAKQQIANGVSLQQLVQNQAQGALLQLENDVNGVANSNDNSIQDVLGVNSYPNNQGNNQYQQTSDSGEQQTSTATTTHIQKQQTSATQLQGQQQTSSSTNIQVQGQETEHSNSNQQVNYSTATSVQGRQ